MQAQSDAAYDYLTDVFWFDWGEIKKHFVYLPAALRDYPPPLPYKPTLHAISNADGDGD